MCLYRWLDSVRRFQVHLPHFPNVTCGCKWPTESIQDCPTLFTFGTCLGYELALRDCVPCKSSFLYSVCNTFMPVLLGNGLFESVLFWMPWKLNKSQSNWNETSDELVESEKQECSCSPLLNCWKPIEAWKSGSKIAANSLTETIYLVRQLGD